MIWAKQAVDNRSDDAYALAVGPASGVVLGGPFVSSILLDAVSDTGGGSGTDGFVAQLGIPPAVARLSARYLRPGIQLEISGPAGATVIVEGATGFHPPIIWQRLYEWVLPASPVLWTDPQAVLSNHDFYRLVIQPSLSEAIGKPKSCH